MSIEAMKQALEALSYVMSHGVAVRQAKDILLEAIEQAEKQEIEPDRDCVENDGCPTEKAVLQRFWREHQQAEKPEPVADKRIKIKIGSQYGSDLCGQWFYLAPANDSASTALTAHTGIATPPQREWQGLTDEDIYSIIESNVPPKLTSLFEMAEWVAKVVEVKLREKNDAI